jgi:hypothetical protein
MVCLLNTVTSLSFFKGGEMKIVAKVSDDRVLVEMTREELTKVATGVHYPYANMEVGRKYEVDKIWERLSSLSRNQKKLSEARQSLVAIASLLEPLECVVGCDPAVEILNVTA